ncbi:hypothetical protein [Altibacter sp. HG106]|uniref:hypothetical protein n=1 Tax=Altibacter sp. HG106 TaxID=3023937 RepID=UPI00235061EA|nr:hypothetical protein [Altibacter sp. HG106]MDC7993682.1 hypothetical protein [Altibacter sp. HG106]
MKTITCILLLLMGSMGFSQNNKAKVESLLNQFTTELTERGITNFFTTKRYCLGTTEMFRIGNNEICTSEGTYYESYVLWQEPEGDVMIKKIDNCGVFTPISVGATNPISFYMTHLSTLQKEDVKPYQVQNPGNRPTQRTQTHPCRRDFSFYADAEDTVHTTYRLYDMTNGSSQPNLNYEHNKNLKITTLDAMMDEVIEANANRFRREL